MGRMERGLLDRPSQHHNDAEAVTSPVPLRLLDRALDREFTRACALVGAAAEAGTQVILTANAGAHPVALFWAACDARAAQLCDRYGVELLLIEEHGQVQIRIDRYQPPGPVATTRWRWLSWCHWRWPGKLGRQT